MFSFADGKSPENPGSHGVHAKRERDAVLHGKTLCSMEVSLASHPSRLARSTGWRAQTLSTRIRGTSKSGRNTTDVFPTFGPARGPSMQSGLCRADHTLGNPIGRSR